MFNKKEKKAAKSCFYDEPFLEKNTHYKLHCTVTANIVSFFVIKKVAIYIALPLCCDCKHGTRQKYLHYKLQR